MKIKKKRQVRLDELLSLVWSNKFDYLVFMSDNNNFIDFDMSGMIRQAYGIKPDDLFTIIEEVEITEEMELKQLVVIYENGGSGKIRNMNIKELVERHESVYGHGVPIKFIYLQNEDGSIGELIWSKERGLID